MRQTVRIGKVLLLLLAVRLISASDGRLLALHTDRPDVPGTVSFRTVQIIVVAVGVIVVVHRTVMVVIIAGK